jgi:hypothetical protein
MRNLPVVLPSQLQLPSKAEFCTLSADSYGVDCINRALDFRVDLACGSDTIVLVLLQTHGSIRGSVLAIAATSTEQHRTGTAAC